MRPPSEITAELEAIDATLAGQAVDPRHAELAELSLLLSDLRPGLEPAAAARLDARLAAVERRAPRWARRWQPRALGALAGAVGAAAAAVVVIGGGGGTGTPGPVTESAPA